MVISGHAKYDPVTVVLAAHLLQQSAICCLALGAPGEGGKRLRLALQLMMAEGPRFLDGQRGRASAVIL